MTRPADTTSSSGRPPNIIVIMSDQHRHDLMGCAGRDRVPTPHLDRLAALGTRFTDAYCPSPVCLPSRMSFMTGQPPSALGAVGNYDLLDPQVPTFADHFAAQGYLTGLIGKMHFRDAANHGFQYYLSINDWLAYLGPKAQHYADEIASNPIAEKFAETVRDAGSGFPDVDDLWEGESPWAGRVTPKSMDHMATELAAEDTLDMFVARESIRFCERFADRPYLLVAGFMRPHPPMYPPAPWDAAYEPADMRLQVAGDTGHFASRTRRRAAAFAAMSPERLQADRAGYYGNLAFLDHCVGQLLDGLGAIGQLEDTIIIYTSDHGDMDGDHGLYHKGVMLESAVRVPLVAAWPGRIPAGLTCDVPVSIIDLYPTMAELAGRQAPSGIVAESFASLLREPGQQPERSVYACLGTDHRMIRRGAWKYIWNRDDRDELFHLSEDPGETLNRAQDADRQELLASLKRDLTAYYAG